MRHRVHHRKLNRTSEHRLALRRNLAQSLVEHGRVTTTLPKAKDVQPFLERLVTLAVKLRKFEADGERSRALGARRTIYRLLGDRGIIPAEHREAYNSMSDAARAKTLRMASGRRHRTGEPRGRLDFTAESVTHRLIEFVAPKFEDRPGGYTRLIRLAKPRLGDDAATAMVQLLGDEEAPVSLAKPKRTSRRLRADARYAFAIKSAKAWSGRGGAKAAAGKPAGKASPDEATPKSESAADSGTPADDSDAAGK